MKIQIRILSVLFLLLMNFGLAACGSIPSDQKPATAVRQTAENKPTVSPAVTKTEALPAQTGSNEKTEGIKIKVTAGSQVLTATLLDNATTRSLIAKFPLTVPMQNLYSREMVYRFPESLPANEAQTSGYEVGDISYWTPRHSFVIFYAQNGEVISNLQKIGRFDSNLDFFKSVGAVDVRFELVKE